MDALEGVYDGFCNICAISGILNADQVFCILCDLDLDQDDVDGQDPEVIDVPALCFSEISTVQVQNVGSVAMKDLELGSRVLTQSGSYEPVYAWGHKHATKSAEFLQLQTKESKLEMTGGHLVFLEGKANPVRADSVKVGDTLQGNNNGKVKKIKAIQRNGVYTPLTPSGTVVVDGIVASSYISLQKNADEFVQFQGGISSYLSFQDAIHMVLSPFRMLCMGVSSKLGNIYTEEGVPLYAAYGMEFASWVEQQNIVVQLILFLAVGALTGASLFVENTFGPSLGPLAVLVGASAYAVMKRNTCMKIKSV